MNEDGDKLLGLVQELASKQGEDNKIEINEKLIRKLASGLWGYKRLCACCIYPLLVAWLFWICNTMVPCKASSCIAGLARSCHRRTCCTASVSASQNMSACMQCWYICLQVLLVS